MIANKDEFTALTERSRRGKCSLTDLFVELVDIIVGLVRCLYEGGVLLHFLRSGHLAMKGVTFEIKKDTKKAAKRKNML